MSEMKTLRPMLCAEQLAELIQCHPRHIPRMESAGKIPRGFKLGQLKRWNRDVIDKWMADGCPQQEVTQ